jgi:succinoglycan biosynthesis protein ExoV
MEVIYYRSPDGNFGDDLNAVLWREVLPPACFEAEDAVLLGVGSIFRDDFLSEEATERKRVFVLGSGAGTGPLPRRWPNANWSILAVRGPLTASVIGLPQAAMTDSAALIAGTPALLPQKEKASSRARIAFIPHYNSVLYSRWPEICEMTGITFVDSHWPVQDVIERIGQARLVITEAMHGAIIADTLRVPWVPVVCSPEISPFKWIDWTESLDLDYRPLALPASSAWEALRNFKNRTVNGARGLDGLSDRDQDILEEFYRRFGNAAGTDLLRKPLISRGLAKRAQAVTAPFDRIFRERAAEALVAAGKSPPFLSKDNVFIDRLDSLQNAVNRLQHALIGSMH